MGAARGPSNADGSAAWPATTISLCFMVVTVLILVVTLMPAVRRKHEIRGN
jgi:hypothetical protein